MSSLVRSAAVALLVSFGGGLAAAAQEREYQVKAAFLLNFARFIDWPPAAFEGPDAPLDICVFGDNPFDGALEQAVADERAAGRRVQARTISAPADARRCQIVFVPRTRRSDTAPLLNAIQRRPVISVGEADDFLHSGGIIQLFVEDRRVRFAIDAQAADRRGIHVSSHLLRLARSTGEGIRP